MSTRRRAHLKKLGPNGSNGRAATKNHSTMTLRELREAVNKTQSDVARSTSMSQPQLSRFEGRHDHLTSTLRRYVRALGGEVEVVARMGTKRIRLRDV